MLLTCREYGVTSKLFTFLDDHTVLKILAFGHQAIACNDLRLLVEVNRMLRELAKRKAEKAP